MRKDRLQVIFADTNFLLPFVDDTDVNHGEVRELLLTCAKRGMKLRCATPTQILGSLTEK